MHRSFGSKSPHIQNFDQCFFHDVKITPRYGKQYNIRRVDGCGCNLHELTLDPTRPRFVFRAQTSLQYVTGKFPPGYCSTTTRPPL